MNATKCRLELIIAASLLIVLACASAIIAEDSQVPMISVDQLDKMLGRSDVIIVDARATSAWASAATKIAGAVRKDPDHIDSWVGELPKDKDVVLYCS
jgi:rhodanese-related sulfurtransferase